MLWVDLTQDTAALPSQVWATTLAPSNNPRNPETLILPLTPPFSLQWALGWKPDTGRSQAPRGNLPPQLWQPQTIVAVLMKQASSKQCSPAKGQGLKWHKSEAICQVSDGHLQPACMTA